MSERPKNLAAGRTRGPIPACSPPANPAHGPSPSFLFWPRTRAPSRPVSLERNRSGGQSYEARSPAPRRAPSPCANPSPRSLGGVFRSQRGLGAGARTRRPCPLPRVPPAPRDPRAPSDPLRTSRAPTCRSRRARFPQVPGFTDGFLAIDAAPRPTGAAESGPAGLGARPVMCMTRANVLEVGGGGEGARRPPPGEARVPHLTTSFPSLSPRPRAQGHASQEQAAAAAAAAQRPEAPRRGRGLV